MSNEATPQHLIALAEALGRKIPSMDEETIRARVDAECSLLPARDREWLVDELLARPV